MTYCYPFLELEQYLSYGLGDVCTQEGQHHSVQNLFHKSLWTVQNHTHTHTHTHKLKKELNKQETNDNDKLQYDKDCCTPCALPLSLSLSLFLTVKQPWIKSWSGTWYMIVKSKQLVWHLVSSKTQWRCSAYFFSYQQRFEMCSTFFLFCFIIILIFFIIIIFMKVNCSITHNW